MNVILIKIKKIRKSPWLTTFLRWILGIVFLYASFDKIAGPESFAVIIQNYQLIPISFTHLVAIILPWMEFYCGILLVLGLWHRAAAFWVTIMTIVFLFALISAYFRGLDIDCGCFGTASSVGLTRIFEDFFLLACSVHILYYPASAIAMENRKDWGLFSTGPYSNA